jgi:hypothetical protein
MPKRIYVESFDSGPGGWCGWTNNIEGPKALEVRDSAAISRSPWWIDYNHAPPGAGYLHILFALNTTAGDSYSELYLERAGINRFVEQGFPTDFTGAKLTFRLKGELESRGANLVLLVQGSVGNTTSGWVLIGQTLNVTADWSQQTIAAAPVPQHWTCLGARHDRTRTYGELDLATVLRDVNANIVLILFPLNVAPMGLLEGHPHKLRAGKDYPVWQCRLPEGYVMLDEIRIEFNGG